MPNALLEKLDADQVVFGLSNMYPAPGIIEGMCGGWDFVWIDAQHGEMSYDSCLHAMHAAAAVGIETVLRVPSHETGVACPLADLCPSALMVPMVDTPEDAAAVVKNLQFPPLGNRSYGGRRAVDIHGRQYYAEQRMMMIAQIETLEAVENAEAIIGRDGIDLLFFGPDDMKLRMGIDVNTAMTEHPRLREAMQQTANAARAAGKYCGTVAFDLPSVQLAFEMGYRLLVSGSDIAFLRLLSSQKIAELRETFGTTNS